MKFLILVITTTWSFSFGTDLPNETYIVVPSEERAAMIVYQDKKSAPSVEPDQKDYKLYSVEVDTGQLFMWNENLMNKKFKKCEDPCGFVGLFKEIPIPKVIFE
jgi:hypothetical protein